MSEVEVKNVSGFEFKSKKDLQRYGVLSKIKSVRESTDIKEVAQLLASGNWIAVCATDREPYLFSMGRIVDVDDGLDEK